MENKPYYIWWDDEAEYTYTIQNRKGDYGYIQRFDEDCKEYDDVQERTSFLNPACLDAYIIISKEDYDKILAMWQDDEDGGPDCEAISELIDETIKKYTK